MKTARTLRVEHRRVRDAVEALVARIKELATARHGTAEGKELEAVMVAVHEFEAKSPAASSRPW